MQEGTGKIARWRRFTPEELQELALQSNTRAEFGRSLGYLDGHSARRAVRQVCKEYDIVVPHWKTKSCFDRILPLSDAEICDIYEQSNGILEFAHAITGGELQNPYAYNIAERTIKRLELPPKQIRTHHDEEELLQLITVVQDYQELEEITGINRDSLYGIVSRLRKKFGVETPNLSNRTARHFKSGKYYQDITDQKYIREARLVSFLFAQGRHHCAECGCKISSKSEGNIWHIDNNCYENSADNLELLCSSCFFDRARQNKNVEMEPMTSENQNSRGIYAIVDLNNNKIYIGMTTVSFQDRIFSHLSKHNTKIDKALHEKGIENFLFGVIENMKDSTTKEIAKRERYWIEFYHSNKENIGYNCPTAAQYRDSVPDEVVLLIHQLLLTTTKSHIEIAAECHVDDSYISLINHGKIRKQDGYTYPLRTVERTKPDIYYETTCQCGKPKSIGAKFCSECARQQQMVFFVDKEQLLDLILSKPFTEIGTMFGVNDNSVRKRARKMGLPVSKKEIKEYKQQHNLL